MAISDIKKIVADYMGTTVELINSRNRFKNVALARQIAMFYSHLMGNTQEEVGEKFDRVHTNVTHAVKKVKQWRECDPEIRAMLEGIEGQYPQLRGKSC
jgi:chromosomal replication initiation ATPase DnaA